MAKHQVADIRNLAFVGHGASGKTTLADLLLFKAGVGSRAGSVDDGTSLLDTDDDEKERKSSITSTVIHAEHDGKRLNIREGLKRHQEQSLELTKKHDIDLVLLDLTMPNLSGADTFKRIRAEFGDVPVIVCSGYTVDLEEFEAENGARPNGFVQKPYNIADLAHQVREVLNEACLTA